MLENKFSYPYANELNMYYCGKRVQTPNHSYGPEIRTHFLIVLIKEGHATLFHKDGDIRMGAGNLLVMFPNERIYYKVDEGALWTISWVGVYGSVVRDFLDIVGITANNPVYTVGNTQHLGEILENIYHFSFSDTLDDKIKCISLLYEFFSYLMKEKNVHGKCNYIEEAKHIIEYNYDKNLKVSEIAKMLHLPMCYFSRIFKESENISPKAYILNKKIDRACQLLNNGNYKIYEVSMSVGIYDSLYFSRIFKKRTGLSPSEYIRKQISTE